MKRKYKPLGAGYDKEDQWNNFGMRKIYAKRVIKDMYSGKNQKELLDKIDECKTILDIDNVLIFGRRNYL